MIQLPKDADGREIPLDTKVLYGSGGTARNIVYWVYTVDSDLEKEWGNCWRAVTDAGRKLDAELMYLTEPDSWEKLEDDLNRVVENNDAFYEAPCAYMNQSGAVCNGCRLHGRHTRNCTEEMFKDVVSRIRKLKGED